MLAITGDQTDDELINSGLDIVSVMHTSSVSA